MTYLTVDVLVKVLENRGFSHHNAKELARNCCDIHIGCIEGDWGEWETPSLRGIGIVFGLLGVEIPAWFYTCPIATC